MLTRKSTAIWRGNGLKGTGALTTQSGAFHDQPYSFQTRFVSEDGTAGTNPEELLGAAHAGCYAMALSFALSGAGHEPEELRVVADVNMDSEGIHWFVKQITLHLEAKVPGIEAAKFIELAENAKKTCPISKALSAIEIVLDAKLL
jgi:lipoyl-dependent peroxiredoxin